MSITGAIGAAALANSVVYGKDDAPVSQEKTAKPDFPIKNRVFWTWDHSTEWALCRYGSQTFGASNYYGRTNELFLEDYTKLLEWCGRHHVDAVVVWGLLRDSHGGVESVKKLCDVANKNNVKLLCGVGMNAYGGVYYEGNSPYNLDKHLTDHPELTAIDANGNKMVFPFGLCGPKVTHHACPSRKENHEFAVEALKWLFKTLPDLGGVQMESGDTQVCKCDLCKKRRQHDVVSFSLEDQALMYPMAVEAIRSVKPDAFIICETYSHPEKEKDPTKVPEFGCGRPVWSDEVFDKFPEGVIIQYAGDQFFPPNGGMKWTDAGMVTDKRHRHLMRAHFGTYWMGIRGELAIDWIADMAQKSIAHGIDGISIFGEVSPYETGAELNYLAFENFGSAANPKADLNVFLKDVAGPLLGGEKEAHDFLKCARTRSNREQVPDALKEIYAHICKVPPDAARRWAWLASFLAKTVY